MLLHAPFALSAFCCNKQLSKKFKIWDLKVEIIGELSVNPPVDAPISRANHFLGSNFELI